MASKWPNRCCPNDESFFTSIENRCTFCPVGAIIHPKEAKNGKIVCESCKAENQEYFVYIFTDDLFIK